MTNPNEAATGYGYANQYTVRSTTGLTKREYFAAIAMQGILAKGMQSDEVIVANYSVEYADALIEALNKDK